MLKLRPEVRRFAEAMERKLRKGDERWGPDGWRSMHDEDIDERIDEELEEFAADPVIEEAADVANFLMFRVNRRRHPPRYR